MTRLRELGHDLIPLEEVRETILRHVDRLPAEEVPLLEAWDRVLAEDLAVKELIPPFDNSAMDGYAVRAGDLEGASPERPVTLRVRGRIQAGDPPGFQLSEAQLPQIGLPQIGHPQIGAAARIMTGAPIPQDADAVVPHELTRFTDTEVTFTAAAASGQNIRRAGGDMKPGEVPVGKGTRLRGPQLAVAAALGLARIKVSRRPRVAIISPGKELVWPGEPAGPGQIRNSNAYALAGLLREGGAAPEVGRIIEDSTHALRREFRRALEGGVDALLTTGGVSAGDYDFVQQVVREDGSPGYVFKAAMRPGKPQVFGVLGGKPLFGLPGNPASAIISFTVFVLPALRKMLGEEPVVPPVFPVRFTSDFSYRGGRTFLLRAAVEPDFEHPGGGFRVRSIGGQDSSFLSSLAAANALIQLPAGRDGVKAGEILPAWWIHPA
ncbi:MAG: molybdopterin molybdotransferase MoeA [Planctomycetes bacterium]|nr:molybdopterin molybdotransferase MoeA [Planctomycetota bacterium]